MRTVRRRRETRDHEILDDFAAFAGAVQLADNLQVDSCKPPIIATQMLLRGQARRCPSPAGSRGPFRKRSRRAALRGSNNHCVSACASYLLLDEQRIRLNKVSRKTSKSSSDTNAGDVEEPRRSDPATVLIARSRTLTVLLLLLLLPSRTPASELYFSQSDLAVRVPYSPSGQIKLLELRTLRNDSTEPRNVKYSVTAAHEGDVASIDPETNALRLQSSNRDQFKRDMITVVVLAEEKGASNQAFLEIKVQPILEDQKTVNCSEYIEDMCFWNTSTYRIYENQPSTMIGTFGPAVYGELCPSFRVTGYKLLNGTEYFYSVNETLFANASLDRDVMGPWPLGPGPKINLQVQCIVWEENTGRQYAPIKLLEVDILDQDDNLPVAQGNDSLTIKLGDFTVGDKLVDDNSLILKDADEATSNRYSIRILGDTHHALNVTFNTLPIEIPGGVSYTAILTRIFAKTTLLPKSPYRVTLQVQDINLVPRSNDNTLNITMTFHGPEHVPSTTTPSSVSFKQQFSYPSSARVARIASRYSRVAKPSSEPHSSVNFSIHGSSAFAITQKGGIVYVADEQLLKTEPENVT